jgi:hypothetical protein
VQCEPLERGAFVFKGVRLGFYVMVVIGLARLEFKVSFNQNPTFFSFLCFRKCRATHA